MTILHLLALGDVGGVPRVVEALALGQRRHGHAVQVAAVVERSFTGHPMVTALEEGGVVVHLLRLSGRAYLEERRRIAGLCRRLRPDIVHTHGYRSDVMAAGVARRCGVPVVTTVHGFTGGGWRNRFYEWLQCRSYRHFDAVVAVSRRLAKELVGRGVPGAQLHAVANAWGGWTARMDPASARAELGVPEGVFHLGWVGRISPEKGPDLLVDALAYLADIPVIVSFIGDGSARAAVLERAAALGVRDRIRWHGIIHGADRLFPAFDAFVLSSRTEGTPIVLFEAMHAGVPAVVTAVGGVPDVVSMAEALVVPPNDTAALAAAIRMVHDDPAGAADRAVRARQRLDREFTLSAWVERYDQVYESIQPSRSVVVAL